MIKILSVDGNFFIVRIRDIFMMKSHGSKTLIYVYKLEKPIIIEGNISKIIEDLVDQGVLKNLKSLVYTQPSWMHCIFNT